MGNRWTGSWAGRWLTGRMVGRWLGVMYFQAGALKIKQPLKTWQVYYPAKIANGWQNRWVGLKGFREIASFKPGDGWLQKLVLIIGLN